MKQSEKDGWDLTVSIFTAIGALGTLVAILVSIRVATRQIAEQRDEARVTHLVEEVDRFGKDPILKSRINLAEKRMDRVVGRLRLYDPAEPPAELWDVLNACDQMGLLAKRGYLDVHDVWSEMGFWLFNIYADASDAIEANQRLSPAAMENCVSLVQQMTPIELKENKGADLHPTQKELYDFYDSESSQVVNGSKNRNKH